MSEQLVKALPCGCEAKTFRDFLGRVVGTIVMKSPTCERPEHTLGQTVIMPGRENARPE
ncbi:MAG TPA: hypothetical protein VFP16_13975 [Vicinamibacterales bacterium]|nr:hypothetical protein [Vicinamibacterales bacterium]